MRAYQGLQNVSFSENFTHLLNRWPLTEGRLQEKIILHETLPENYDGTVQ